MLDATITPDAQLLAATVGVDRDGCNGFQLEELLMARRRLIARLEAECLLDVEALAHTPPGPDDGPARRTARRDPHVGDVVAATLSWTRYAGEMFAGLAHQLVELPGTMAALADGRIDLPKVKIIATGVNVLSDPLDRQKVENAVLGDAETRTTGWLRADVATQVLRIDPEAGKKRHKERVEDRGVTFYPDQDSTANILIHGLPLDQAAEAEAYLRALVDTTKAAGDTRTRPQLRADLASALLRGKAVIEHDDDTPCPPPTDDKPGRRRNGAKIVLTAPLPTLLGLGTRPATLGAYGPIITDIARQLIARLAADPDTTLCWAATDPATGHTLHTGRVNTRYLRGLMHDHITIRDQTCRFTGCRHPAQTCRADHTTNHTDDGPTCTCNTGPLCAHHDTIKQTRTWKMRQPTPGYFQWTDPHGRTYTVDPPQLTDPIPIPF